ncbi:MAG: hypothetical protein IPL59_01940 [Candidatus Competibacteraceae bacterium]|nr:hypothetical protein [Candidatus Competibacteraceae bacterium]
MHLQSLARGSIFGPFHVLNAGNNEPSNNMKRPNVLISGRSLISMISINLAKYAEIPPGLYRENASEYIDGDAKTKPSFLNQDLFLFL